ENSHLCPCSNFPEQDPEESWHENYWVPIDLKVPGNPMVDLSTDPVDPNNPADPIVDPTDKPAEPVVGPPVDKLDVGPGNNIDKPSAGLNITMRHIIKTGGSLNEAKDWAISNHRTQ
ncbi:hypothetical protein Tco_1355469, partial [Tanacetum coccineum]